MQTPKARRSSLGTPPKSSISPKASQKNSSPEAASSEAPQKASPRVVRQLKIGPRFLDPTASSSNQASKATKQRSPKVADHKSPRSPLSEVQKKKRPSKVPELEGQISQLENDLKIIKDQLISTEAQKKQAQQDAEESNQQLLSLSLKLEELQKQLSPSEEVVFEEQNQSSRDLASALDEIKQLKIQLEIVSQSEASDSQKDIEKLKENLCETLLVVEDMKRQLMDCKDSEARAEALVRETLFQLETAKKTVETLRSDRLKATEAHKTIVNELENSRARVGYLEDLVSKLKSEINGSKKDSDDSLESEVVSLRLEVERLKSDLEQAEIRYDEEQGIIAEQIRNAMEMVEKMKAGSSQRETELEAEIRRSKYEIEELRANLMDKETELQGICEENEELIVKLESSVSGQRENELEKKLRDSKAEIDNLKVGLVSKEIELHNTTKENEGLKMKFEEMINDNTKDEINDKEAAMMESDKKSTRAAEELEAAQAANAEMEAEMRRVKVQSDQWRKAAEAAAAMLGSNGKMMERTGSMDSHYSPRTGRMGSPYGDCVDDDDDVMKKKGNGMRRFGVLWKKPQK